MSGWYLAEIVIARRKNDQLLSNIKIPKYPPTSDLPSDVLKYIKKNATPKEAIKLMNVNKFFLLQKCPFTYPGFNLTLHQNNLYRQSGDSTYESIMKVASEVQEVHWYPHAYESKRKTFKIEELPNNLVIGEVLHIYDGSALHKLIPKIIFCDIKCLIMETFIISFDELKFLSGKLQMLELKETIISYNNDEIVPYENLLKQIPSLRHLKIHGSTLPFSQNFMETICVSNVTKLELCRLPETFEFEEFLTFMANKKPNLLIDLYINNSHYIQKKIDKYIDSLLSVGLTNSCPPYLSNIEKKRKEALYELRHKYWERQYEIERNSKKLQNDFCHEKHVIFPYFLQLKLFDKTI